MNDCNVLTFAHGFAHFLTVFSSQRTVSDYSPKQTRVAVIWLWCSQPPTIYLVQPGILCGCYSCNHVYFIVKSV